MKTPVLDLAVVGGGLAGLAAARRAQELGLSVEVFEASDGIGGRVRSDEIEGYICDRGFQLINPAYPALARYYKAENFHRLERSIDVVMGARSYRLGDPRQGLATMPGNLSSATGTIGEKLRFLNYLRRLNRRSERDGEGGALDPSFEDEMHREGIGSFYSKVIAPFASGVFLNLPSKVSARIAQDLIRYFLIGSPGLPHGGVGTVAGAISTGVAVNLHSPVDEIGEDFIRIGRRRVKVRSVIVATDPYSAKTLINPDEKRNQSLSYSLASKMSGSTTWYHSADDQDFPAILRIDGSGGGPVTNTIAISRLAPEYAPEGKTLISTTVMSAYGLEIAEARVRRHLAQLWHRDTSRWRLIAKYSIPKSLPLMTPGYECEEVIDFTPTAKRSKNSKSPMLRYLAGDFLALPAQQGAVQSGIRAAELLASRL